MKIVSGHTPRHSSSPAPRYPSRRGHISQSHRATKLEGCPGGKAPTGPIHYPTPQPPPYVVPELPGMDGPQNTSGLERLLAKVRHVSMQRAFLDVAGPFPVAGPASWSNDWHAPRPCPFPHLHEGLDIFAARGTPAVAAASGTVTEVIKDPITGLGVQMIDTHGLEYLYAHLSAYANGLVAGEHVKRGQVLGFVGNTGDASGGATHLHFQIMPQGIPMPPKPLVDRWLLGEMRRARTMLRPHRDARHPSRRTATTAWRWRRRVERIAPTTWAMSAPASVSASRSQPHPTTASVLHATAASSTPPTVPEGFLGAMGGLLVVGFFARRRALARSDE